MAQHRVRNINSQRAIADEPELSREKRAAISAAKDFMSYGVPGYDAALIKGLKAAQNSAEIRDLLRKARAAS